MSDERSGWQPRRLSDADSDAPDLLRAALRDARALNVDGARVARLADRLGVHVALENAAVGALSEAPAAHAVAYKLWAYLSGVVALSGVALVMWNHAYADKPSAAASHVARASDAAPALVAEPPLPSPEPLRVEEASEQGSAAPVVRPASQARKRRHSDDASSSTISEAAHETTTRALLDPQAELRLLGAAQDALAQAPRRALAMTLEHATRFPAGVFAQEREVIAIEALLKLRQSDAALERGRAFLSAFPSSTHAPRVQLMLPTP